MWASMNGHSEVVDVLMKHGADVDAEDVSFECVQDHTSYYICFHTKGRGMDCSYSFHV